ncbi:MAG: GNAT family N-acetyltransferase [Gammaproteobacteria bacterium]|nr:GNAT family N-acetyltransferase [Gammaproteobacteria bacterium]
MSQPMQSDWQIRQAIAADADRLTSCMHAAYSRHQIHISKELLPPMQVDYSSEINQYPVWVVEMNRKIVGGLIMVFDPEEASIANIAVDPSAQGMGIGGALMKMAESQGKERGFRFLHLATHVVLEGNLSLYQHLGWQKVGGDKHRIFMRKSI